MSIPETTEKPDQNAVNLARLLSRLEHNLLPQEAEKRYNSSYERAKVGAVGIAFHIHLNNKPSDMMPRTLTMLALFCYASSTTAQA